MKGVATDIGTIHFVGIGGIGMSGIAEVMHNLGYSVQGSDIAESYVVEGLRAKGIEVKIGQCAENVDDVAVVVISTAIKRGNPEVEAALDAIIARDPTGATHMAAGVDQATIELLGLRGSVSRSDPRSEKIVLFFTDGTPTLPYQGFERENVRAVLRAANRADRADIRIHSFAIGPDALEGPVATVEMASRTDGFFTPVRHPGDLVEVIEAVSFANLGEVSLQNLTTGKPADLFRATADGAWAGFVPMDPGENEIEVRAQSSDGATGQKKIRVTLAAEAPDPQVPTDLVTARNRLLEDCLVLLLTVDGSLDPGHHALLVGSVVVVRRVEGRFGRGRGPRGWPPDGGRGFRSPTAGVRSVRWPDPHRSGGPGDASASGTSSRACG